MDGNAFAPLKLNHLYTHEMMLCQRGMEIREGSGEKGFFQIRLKSTPPAATKIENGGITSIGLATRKVFLGGELGLSLEAIAWARLPNGSCKIFCSKDLVIIPEIGERGRYCTANIHPWHQNSGELVYILDAPNFLVGDTLGLLVDCSDKPTLIFVKNGVLVDKLVMAQTAHGKVLFPAFGRKTQQRIDMCFSNSVVPVL